MALVHNLDFYSIGAFYYQITVGNQLEEKCQDVCVWVGECVCLCLCVCAWVWVCVCVCYRKERPDILIQMLTQNAPGCILVI